MHAKNLPFFRGLNVGFVPNPEYHPMHSNGSFQEAGPQVLRIKRWYDLLYGLAFTPLSVLDDGQPRTPKPRGATVPGMSRQ